MPAWFRRPYASGWGVGQRRGADGEQRIYWINSASDGWDTRFGRTIVSRRIGGMLQRRADDWGWRPIVRTLFSGYDRDARTVSTIVVRWARELLQRSCARKHYLEA